MLDKLLFMVTGWDLVFTVVSLLSSEDPVHASEVIFLCAGETNYLHEPNLLLPHDAPDLVKSGRAAAGGLWQVHYSDRLLLASPLGFLRAPVPLATATHDSLPPARLTRIF